MKNTNEPKLAPPGAGLPLIELWVGGALFTLRGKWGTLESFTKRFESERAKIQTLVDSCDPESAGRQVLIARPRGLEDSSRYWSIWMTLDHLRITNTVFATFIRSLIEGKVPAGKASTAAVKPTVGVGSEVIEEYQKSCDAVLSSIHGTAELRTAAKYAHPWFGEMNAREWYALAGSHMGIHRVQIERIRGV